MSLLEILAYVVGIPVLLVALLSARIWSRRGAHPPAYKMSQPWTHPPILWAATDEVIGASHGRGQAKFSVGGGASGKW